MKYYVIADVHGYYDLMKAALDNAGFDPTNKNHTLISLGDVFDRGSQPIEVAKYLNSLPRKILIRGNHDDLLQDLIDGKREYDFYDEQNGTFDTIRLFAEATKGLKISESLMRIDFKENAKYAKMNKDLQQYLKSTVNAYELKNYIFVHAWIPVKIDSQWIKDDKLSAYRVLNYQYYKDWRKADNILWKDTRWLSGVKGTIAKVFEPGKKIVCGHWHCSAWNWIYKDAKGEYSDFSLYEDENVIAVDACTAYSGKVNVAIVEAESNGIKY